VPDDRRLLRLQQLVLETIATTVQQDLDDPRIGLVTITRVKLAKDLTQAVVYWSCLEEGGPRRTAERGLADALPVIQGKVAGALSTRLTPRLTLKFDTGMEKADRLDTIFSQLALDRGEKPTGVGPQAKPGKAAKPDEAAEPGDAAEPEAPAEPDETVEPEDTKPDADDEE
jgi:ribosome-binding factor A